MHFSIDYYNKNIATISDEKERVEQKVIFLTGAFDYLGKDCFHITEELYKEACEKNQQDLKCVCLIYQSFSKKVLGQDEESMKIFSEAEKLSHGLEVSMFSAIAIQMISFNYWGIGQREKAFEYTYRSLRMTEQFTNAAPGWAHFQLGVFHTDLKDLDIALDYFKKAESLSLKHGYGYQLARSRSGIASILISKNEIEEAFRYSTLALKDYQNSGHKTAESRALNDLGVIHKKLGNKVEAEKYLREALAIRESLNYIPGIITSKMELAELLMLADSLEKAEELLLSALNLSLKSDSKQKAAQAHKLLSDLYKKTGDPWKALEHIEKFHLAKSNIAGEEATNRINSLQQKFATEKSEQETEIHRLKNVELKKAYGEIEEKNKSILDSIHYAKRIQGALLPSDNLLNKNLPEYFVFYKPKDIVSGDFYWAHQGTGDLFFLAACDCTGHGVPGAFMSLINSTFLNEAVIEKGLSKPGEILNDVRKHLVAALNPEGSKEETRDGMDATLIALNKKTNVLSFACANNPLLLIRNGELKTFAPDKFPVGIYPGYESKPFSNHQVELKKGDCIYLLTDGFGDQFGGTQGKKFKIKKLKELLLEIHKIPSSEQGIALGKCHDEWKGELEQVDDILIIGIRI